MLTDASEEMSQQSPVRSGSSITLCFQVREGKSAPWDLDDIRTRRAILKEYWLVEDLWHTPNRRSHEIFLEAGPKESKPTHRPYTRNHFNKGVRT